MSIWDKKEAFDELLFCIENFKNELISKYLNLKYQPGRFTFNGVENLQKKQFAEIIANGPSSKTHKIDPSAQQFYMNFGFLHASFPCAENPVLTIVDKKLINGGWSLDMIKEAYQKNSSTVFAFNIEFIRSQEIRDLAKEYKVIFYIIFESQRWAKKPKFLIGEPSYGGGATESSIALAASLSYKVLTVSGFDGNNVILGLSSKQTHFYGQDPSKNWSDPNFSARELRFLSYFIDKNVHLARLLKVAGVEVRLIKPTIFMNMYSAHK